MKILKILKKIHNYNFDSIKDVESIFANLFIDYGYEKDEDIPNWFLKLFELIDRKEEGEFLFDKTDSETSSLISEFGDELGWNVEDYGEGIILKFKKSNLKVFISRESVNNEGKHCCSVSVCRMGKGPKPCPSFI